MLKATDYGPVKVFKMGRSLGPYVPYAVHAFLLEDTLIDTGTVMAGREFMNALNGRPIKRIVNTHEHEDHTGNNAAVQKAWNVPALAHRSAVPLIRDPRELKLRAYQRFVWRYPGPSVAGELGETVPAGGYSLNVLPAAGHCPGHVCLYEPRLGLLFTGDMFCGVKNIYLRADEDFNRILSTIERLRELDVSALFCALKGAVPNGNEALRAKADFMKELRGRVTDLHGRGLSPAAIRKRLLGREDHMYCITAGHFSKQGIVDSILAGAGLIRT